MCNSNIQVNIYHIVDHIHQVYIYNHQCYHRIEYYSMQQHNHMLYIHWNLSNQNHNDLLRIDHILNQLHLDDNDMFQQMNRNAQFQFDRRYSLIIKIAKKKTKSNQHKLKKTLKTINEKWKHCEKIITLAILLNSISVIEWFTVITCRSKCIISTFNTFTSYWIASTFFIWINVSRALTRLTKLTFNSWSSIKTTRTTLTFFSSITFTTCAMNSITIFWYFTSSGKA